jgi:hypothetical protein
MASEIKAFTFALGLATALLALPAEAQTRIGTNAKQAPLGSSDVGSLLGCPRPADAKEAKVVDFDASNATARLAVNLGSGRFKLVTIKAWDRPEDPRPIVPVIEAARITQGKLQFFTPDLNSDPESTPNTFIMMIDMGGGYVCWATPSSLLKEGAYPVADKGNANSDAAISVNLPLGAGNAPSEATRPAAQAQPPLLDAGGGRSPRRRSSSSAAEATTAGGSRPAMTQP